MKTKILRLMLLVTLAQFLQGCLALPPLVHVQHREAKAAPSKDEQELLKRLDAIDERLSKLEAKPR